MAILLASLAVGGGCGGPRHTYLDEYVWHDTPDLTLKVVRYYENLPFQYIGDIYVVLCSSPQSRDLPAGEVNAAGWRVIGRGSDLKSLGARAMAARVRNRYLLPAPGVVIYAYVPIHFYLEGCRTVVSWNPASLPADRVRPFKKPEYCDTLPRDNCAMLDFQGERLPAYSDIELDPNGRIEFTVRSKAFVGTEALSVISVDRGQTWQLEPSEIIAVSPAAGAAAANGEPPCRSGRHRETFGVAAGLEWIPWRDVRTPASPGSKFDDFEAATDAEERVLAARIDISGDGNADLAIRGAETLCGNGGCPFAILDGRDGRWLGEVFGSTLWTTTDAANGEPVLCAVSHLGAGRTNLIEYRRRSAKWNDASTSELDDAAREALLARVRPRGS